MQMIEPNRTIPVKFFQFVSRAEDGDNGALDKHQDDGHAQEHERQVADEGFDGIGSAVLVDIISFRFTVPCIVRSLVYSFMIHTNLRFANQGVAKDEGGG